MTWAMIKQENEFKTTLALYSKQKNQIIRDFNAIKKQVKIIKN